MTDPDDDRVAAPLGLLVLAIVIGGAAVVVRLAAYLWGLG